MKYLYSIIVVVCLVTAGAQAQDAHSARDLAVKSDPRALRAIFGDVHIADAALIVHRRAAKMPAERRYEYLSNWVLPGPNHDTIRTAFDFTPTHPAPPVRGEDRIDVERLRIAEQAGHSRVQIGGNLVSPALDLVEVATELGRLVELSQRVETAPATRGTELRSRGSLLALVDIARGDFAAALNNLDRLFSLVQAADHTEFTSRWPETLVIWEGVRHPEIRDSARDLSSYIQRLLRNSKASGPAAWERFVGSLAARLKQPEQLQSPQAVRQSFNAPPALNNWSVVSRTSAWSRGNGLPCTHWQLSPGKVVHHSGHAADFLYYRIPLRGNFAIECDAGGFGWRDTHPMVAGTWVAPLVDHVSYTLGSFRAERPTVALEPRLSQSGEWIRYRTVVADGVATTFFNGRQIREEPLPAEHDPWIAIRSPYYGFGGARDVRITGTPEIPEQIRLSALPDLTGWVPYFEETVGGEESDWQFDGEMAGGGFVGSKKADLPGSGLESLLRYHRPMLEDGVIQYDFYYSAGQVHVHPVLDRRAFILDPRGVRIHWVTDGSHDRTKLDPLNLIEEPANRRGPDNLPLIANAWNRLRLDLSGNTVSLTLNEQLVYQGDLERTNQRTFGLFHYAGQTEARVRNIIWKGDWPRQLPPLAQQELVGDGADFLNERREELPAIFQHDFVRDGFPLYRFQVYDAGWQEHIKAKPDGLHVHRPVTRGLVRFVVSPRMQFHGDFDATASFEGLVIQPTANGKWGIALCAVVEDKDITLSSIFRGMVRKPGQKGQHIANAGFTRWKPNRRHTTWYGEKTAEEVSFGRLRLARRGDKVYSFIAERDSPHFRHIHTETVGKGSSRYDGIRLKTVGYSADDSIGSASVIWKSLIVRAENITNLPVKPPKEKTLGL